MIVLSDCLRSTLTEPDVGLFCVAAFTAFSVSDKVGPRKVVIQLVSELFERDNRGWIEKSTRVMSLGSNTSPSRVAICVQLWKLSTSWAVLIGAMTSIHEDFLAIRILTFDPWIGHGCANTYLTAVPIHAVTVDGERCSSVTKASLANALLASESWGKDARVWK